MQWIRELMRYRELLYMLSWREVRIRYKQSVMGLLWAVLMPVIITLAGVIVRVAATKLSGRPVSGADVGSIGVKALPWAFFISALRFGTASLAGNSNLVTKIKFPRLVFPLSSVLTSLVDFAVASPLLLILLPLSGVHLSWTMLWAPVLFLVLVLFTAGLTVLCSAANLFFRDVKYLVEVVLTFAIFFTPVLYDADMVGRWRSLLLLNPVAPVLEGLNVTVVHGRQPEFGWIAYSAVIALLFCWGGISFFRRLEPRFAESV
ncbi:MAG TPA: ABC transporter permease [Gemmatimonadales bacterium]|jgi:ABC-type polysaccharide/polyol phosphate export permease